MSMPSLFTWNTTLDGPYFLANTTAVMTINSDMTTITTTVTDDPIIAVAWIDDDSVDTLLGSDELFSFRTVVSAAMR